MAPFSTNAQLDSLPFLRDLTKSYGGSLTLNLNFHSADFSALPSAPLCCPQFESGFGAGFGVAGFIEGLVYEDYKLQLALDFQSLGGKLTKVENETFGVDGEPLEGEFEYTIDASIYSVGLNPKVVKNVYRDLSVFAGARFGFIVGASYEQEEKILKPEGVVFKDTQSDKRNLYSGAIDGASSVLFSLTAGSRWEVPINEDSSLTLAPSLSFDYNLNSFVPDSGWRAFSVRLGASVIFSPKPPKPIENIYERKDLIDTIEVTKPGIAKAEYKRGKLEVKYDSLFKEEERINIITLINSRTDTIFTPREYKLEAKVNAIAVDEDEESEVVKMQVRETLYYNLSPLLNYVFFEENSAAIPKRYNLLSKKEAERFAIDSVYNLNQLQTYYNLLNIIGLRLEKNPKAKLKVVGCNSDYGAEEDNIELSRNRADTVGNYLREVWGVDSSRIEITERNLPENPSREDLPDGREENRRVEIYSNVSEITAPILVNDTLRFSTPSNIRFYPKIESEIGVDKWEIVASQKGKVFKRIGGGDTVPNAVEWNINLEQKTVPVFSDSLQYYMTVENQVGQKAKSPVKKIAVKQIKMKKRENKVGDKLIERFSLILFDFDEVQLRGKNLELKNYIKTRIKDNSKISIIGYSDRTGDTDYNKRLSKSRAENLAKSLGVSVKKAKGVGESVLLFDNDTPEGRFYCRTVEVIIETPLE